MHSINHSINQSPYRAASRIFSSHSESHSLCSFVSHCLLVQRGRLVTFHNIRIAESSSLSQDSFLLSFLAHCMAFLSLLLLLRVLMSLLHSARLNRSDSIWSIYMISKKIPGSRAGNLISPQKSCTALSYLGMSSLAASPIPGSLLGLSSTQRRLRLDLQTR